ncbi:MAG: WD40 repeat domain-containing protein, partial [Chloroflexia bacterium]
MNQPDAEAQDSLLLSNVDLILAGDPSSASSDPLYAFCAQLASTVPQAGDAFREQLRTRLAARAQEQAAQTMGDGRWTMDEQSSSIQSTPAGPSNPSPNPHRPSSIVHRLPQALVPRLSPRTRRFASALAGIAGVALALAFFLGMAAVIKLRTDSTHASQTVTAVALLPATGTPALAATGVASADTARTVQAFEPLHTIQTASGLPDALLGRLMAWSPDSRTLATGAVATLEFWDGATGRLFRTTNIPYISSLAWSPDGRTLAVGVNQDTIKLVDPTTAQVRATLVPGESIPTFPSNATYTGGWITSIAWSPDGRTLAAIFESPPPDKGTSFHPAVVGLWEPVTGKYLRSIHAATANRSVTHFAWSPDGPSLATLSDEFNNQHQTLRLWDPSMGTEQRTLAADRPVVGFAWSRDGHTIAAFSGTAVELRDPLTGKLLRRMPAEPPPDTPNPENQYPSAPGPMPTTEAGYTITPFPTGTSAPPTPTYIHSDEQYGNITEATWSPDGHTLATVDGAYLRLWDPATGRQTKRMTMPNDKYRFAGWSPNGSVLVLLDETAVHLIDPATGDEVRTLSSPGKTVDGIAWSPDDGTLAVLSGPEITLWGLRSGPSPTITPPQGTVLPAATTGPTPPCGTWSLVPAPGPGSTNDLAAVAAISRDDVWAVGSYSNGGPSQGLIERWNGSKWSVVPGPALPIGTNVLRAISAASRDDIWAVGYYTSTNDLQKTLIIHWDGKGWTHVPSPNAGTGQNDLTGVAALSSTDAWAVGSYSADTVNYSGQSQTRILHWDGHAWTQVPSPNPGLDANRLTAITAISSDDVWAAG